MRLKSPRMDEQDNPKTDRPWRYELRARVGAALEKFMAESDRAQWASAFTSNRLHLVIYEHYRASIRETAMIPLGSFSLPLRALGLDPSAVELGGGSKRAALENAVETAMAKFERPDWWV